MMSANAKPTPHNSDQPNTQISNCKAMSGGIIYQSDSLRSSLPPRFMKACGKTAKQYKTNTRSCAYAEAFFVDAQPTRFQASSTHLDSPSTPTCMPLDLHPQYPMGTSVNCLEPAKYVSTFS